MLLILQVALAASFTTFVEEVSTEARAWTEPTLSGTGPAARDAWRGVWLAAGPSDDFDSDGSKRKGDAGVTRALRRAWDPSMPKARSLPAPCVALGWPETSTDPVIGRVDTPTCLLLTEHAALAPDFLLAAEGAGPRNPAPAFDPFMEDEGVLRSTYPLRSLARSTMLLGWAQGDPITPAHAAARLGWDLTLGGDVSVTMSGLATLQDAHDVLKGYALESDGPELQRIATLTDQLLATPTDLNQLARTAYLSSIALMLRAVEPDSGLIHHGTVASRYAPLGSLGDLSGMKVPIMRFLKGPHRETWEQAFQAVSIPDFDARQQALEKLATELEESSGPVAALVGAAASQEVEGLARWDVKITVRRQEGCLIAAAARVALGQPSGDCPLGVELREDGLYSTRNAEEFELKGRWEDAFWMPLPPSPETPTPG